MPSAPEVIVEEKSGTSTVKARLRQRKHKRRFFRRPSDTSRSEPNPQSSIRFEDEDLDEETRRVLATVPAELDPRLVATAGWRGWRHSALTDEQRTALLVASLPAEVRDAPLLNWSEVPRGAKHFLLFGKGRTAPDRTAWALLIAVISRNGVTPHAVRDYVGRVSTVWEAIQERFPDVKSMRDVTSDMWEELGRDRDLMTKREKDFGRYLASVRHLLDWRHGLTPSWQARLEPYMIPIPSPRFSENFIPWRENKRDATVRRKKKTDVLVPIAPLLIAIIQARKESANRFLAWWKDLVQQFEAGNLQPGSRVVFTDCERRPTENANEIEDVLWVETPVRCAFTFTTTWWLRTELAEARARAGHREGLNRVRFLEKHGQLPVHAHEPFLMLDPNEVNQGENSLWWVAAFQEGIFDAPSESRRSGRRQSAYFQVSGLGRAESRLNRVIPDYGLQGLYVVDPDSLYRAILYGTAIALVALTNVVRNSEILQASLDRMEPPIQYRLRGTDGNPIVDPVTGAQKVDVFFGQRWLQKGWHHDKERNLFNVSVAIKPLLEISQMHRDLNGGTVPIANFNRASAKEYDLRPERYIFQWKGTVISPTTLNGVLRVVFAGLNLHDKDGEPIKIASHDLRHVSSHEARAAGIPLEVLAGMMGHTLTRDGQAPAATYMYAAPTEDEQIGFRTAFQAYMVEVANSVPTAPMTVDEVRARVLSGLDDLAREICETYHVYHPVAFGYCGASGLCVRGRNRVLCIGCPFLIPQPQYVGNVDVWIDAYQQLLKVAEASGQGLDAREIRRLLDGLRGIKRIMELLQTSTELPPSLRALSTAA